MKTLVAIVALVAVIVGVGVWQFSDDAAPAGAVLASAGAAAPALQPPAASTPVSAPANNPADAVPVSDMARLSAQAHGADAQQRLQAIEALSRAPRDQALPALRGIATSGEPQIDKPAAVNALRELALGQGDQDGKIREAIREVLYHDDGQNPQLPTVAQDALDVVEESEMK